MDQGQVEFVLSKSVNPFIPISDPGFFLFPFVSLAIARVR